MIKNTHKLLTVVCLFLWFTLANGTDVFAGEWKLIKPVSGKKDVLEISGKKRSYWRLDKDNPLVVKAVGPGELKIYTRMELAQKKNEGVYSFITLIDGERQPLTARATEYTKSAENPKQENQRLGESRTILYDIPQGEHEYRFEVSEDSKDVIYARLLVSNQHEVEISYIAYLPRSFPKEVRITVKEREYIYYRSDINEYIELEVIGPTRIKCVSRLEFDHSMRGKKPYRVQVSQNSHIILTDFFNAEISGTASYSEKSDKVLGKGEIFHIDVPEGKHRYRISTPDPDISLIFRFYLPEKDLGNEDKDRSTVHALLEGFVID